jgi:putative Ca2+/H+ antiporter (TMEM165/GDT1 family)
LECLDAESVEDTFIRLGDVDVSCSTIESAQEGSIVKTLLVVFGSVLLAELGDKTQMATMLYATDKSIPPMYVFVAASSALVLSTLLAVLFGSFITRLVPPATLKLLAGLAFVGVGLWTIFT